MTRSFSEPTRAYSSFFFCWDPNVRQQQTWEISSPTLSLLCRWERHSPPRWKSSPRSHGPLWKETSPDSGFLNFASFYLHSTSAVSYHSALVHKLTECVSFQFGHALFLFHGRKFLNEPVSLSTPERYSQACVYTSRYPWHVSIQADTPDCIRMSFKWSRRRSPMP